MNTKISEAIGIVGSMPGTEGFTMACFKADEVPVGTPLYLHPQPAELAEQQGAEWNDSARLAYLESLAHEPGGLLLHAERKTGQRGLGLGENCGNRTLAQAIDGCATHAEKDRFFALAATGKQQVGDDGLPLVSVTQEFKDQADYDAEISSAVSNLLRNNTLGLSGSLPEMVAALLKLASGQQVGEVPSGMVLIQISDAKALCAYVTHSPRSALAARRVEKLIGEGDSRTGDA